jgi:putative membrane protein
MSEEHFDETGDASRRTLLASERTLLAWLRTGLTVLAVALAVGRIAPEVAGSAKIWPYAALGTGYAVLGIVIVGYGLWRGRQVDRALRLGRWINLDNSAMWSIGILTIVLGVATGVLIVASA